MNVYILIIGIDMITLIYDISEINYNDWKMICATISKKCCFLYFHFFK